MNPSLTFSKVQITRRSQRYTCISQLSNNTRQSRFTDCTGWATEQGLQMFCPTITYIIYIIIIIRLHYIFPRKFLFQRATLFFFFNPKTIFQANLCSPDALLSQVPNVAFPKSFFFSLTKSFLYLFVPTSSLPRPKRALLLHLSPIRNHVLYLEYEAMIARRNLENKVNP